MGIVYPYWKEEIGQKLRNKGVKLHSVTWVSQIVWVVRESQLSI